MLEVKFHVLKYNVLEYHTLNNEDSFHNNDYIIYLSHCTQKSKPTAQ